MCESRNSVKSSRVASFALAQWQSTGLANLDQLGHIHRLATGARRGGRWGTTQLNRGLFVALLAQFQGFCRDLHDEAVGVHVAFATIEQRAVIRTLLEQGRKLDAGTPRFERFGRGLRPARVQRDRRASGHRAGDGRAARRVGSGSGLS
jgi:hypothetical protein